MKKLLLALAVAGALMSSLTAQAAPTLYGKAYLTLDMNQTDTQTTNVKIIPHGVPPTTNAGSTIGNPKSVANNVSALNSNGSRIGIRGSEPVSADMDFLYQLEYAVFVDAETSTSGKPQFTARDSYIGLKHKELGVLRAGRLSTVDVDYATVAKGGVLGGANNLAGYDGERYNNAFVYEAPKFSDVQLSALYAMKEKDATNNTVPNRENFVVAAAYEPEGKPYHFGVSYANAFKSLRFSGDYQITPSILLGALYQNTNFDTGNNENAFALGATYSTNTALTPYAQLDYVTNVKGDTMDSNKRLVVGTIYNFNANTTAHLYGALSRTSELVTKDERKEGVGNVITTRDKVAGFGVGGGIEYKF